MTVAPLLFLLALGRTPEARPDITALVAQLGSDRYAPRKEASVELEKLGREALPALKEARSSKDPEIRARAAELLEKIEVGLMVQPTLVRLDFKDKPLPEIVRELSARTGINLALVPENGAVWNSRRLTLDEAKPLPFWAVLDRLCRTGQLQHNLAFHQSGPGVRGSVIQLYPAPGGMSNVPVSDSGPFRVSLQGLHYQRDVRFGAGNPGFPVGAIMPGQAMLPGHPNLARGVSEQFYLDLQVQAEPRMALSQNGPIRMTEVVDDKNQSLIPIGANNPAVRNSGYFGFTPSGLTIPMQVPLRYPEHPGRTIKRLRGTVPVTLSARKDDPLLVDLADSKGKVFRKDEVTIVVHEVKQDANLQRTSIELSIRGPSGSSEGMGMPNRFANSFLYSNASMPQNQLEILDAQDRPYSQWFPTQTRIDNDEARMTLTLMANDGVGPPAKIRYFEMARASADVAFDFADVPMP